MRAPEFWYQDPVGRDAAPALRLLLAPLGALYAGLGARRIARARPANVGLPVVCVGNLTMGGAGKTPIARAVRALLGEGAAILSRGYAGKDRGPRLVSRDDPAILVGDEPLLHARDGPAFIARDRLAGARAAQAAGARAIVMDDGFQNPALAKDLSILVFDAAAGVGNGAVFPGGPLREPVAAGLARADAAVVVWPSSERIGPIPDYLRAFQGPVMEAWLAPLNAPPEGRLVAFAGRARPKKFFDTLEAAGGVVVDAVPYPDHHVFTPKELLWLASHAHRHDARLITTEKDAVRLPPAWRAQVAVLPVAARFAEPDRLLALLAPIRARLGTIWD